MKQLQTAFGIVPRVERQRWRVLGCFVAVREVGFFLLQVAAVRQQDAAQVMRGGRAVHLAPEALTRQQRQVAAVVNVRVGEDHGVDLSRIDRQRRPVAQAQLLVALEQPAVDQYPRCALLNQVFRAGDGVGSAQKLEFHGRSLGAGAADGLRWIKPRACVGLRQRVYRIK